MLRSSITLTLSALSLDTAEAFLDLVGGKGRALASMASAGMPVPDGFHLTTSAYRQFVTENDLQQAILDLARPAVVEGSVSFESAAIAIQALFEQADLPSEIIAEIQQAYDALSERGEAPAVAVRSSANAEDLPHLSFAGQHDTFLNVRGMDALVTAIRRCWASLWNARALGYRHQMGVAHDAVAMAVVVQRMVEAEVSGILFTANPTTGDRSELVVNASYGLGEAIGGGEVTPDTYVLDRDSLNAKETIIGAKEQMIVSSSGQGTTTEAVPEARREESSLPAPILSELASMAIKVEQHFESVPQDIEWALADGQLWLLQSRPITNLPPQPLKDVRWHPPRERTVHSRS
ncbi:PEP/pyruvate-binding domain-containing protein [Candidatus Poribacteria bacterium]|nr:PEP/pyruvate-binding domain-containing protein [Candidatus Poribacteria bacterium]